MNKFETSEGLPSNYQEILGHLKALAAMSEGMLDVPLSNFRNLARGESAEGKKWLQGKPQFEGWKPEHFRALVSEFEK